MKINFEKIIIVLCLVLGFTSCSKEVKHQVLELKEYDSISVAIDYPYLSNYTRLKPIVRNGELYVVGYNHYEHYYDFVNLSGGKHFSVKLQREGADGVLTPGRYWLHENGIVCQTQAGLVALDMEGKVQHRVSVKELVAPQSIYLDRPRVASLGNYDFAGGFGNLCFVPLSPLKKEGEASIGKAYDMDTRSLELLSALYPNSIQRLASIASLSMPNISGDKNKIVYNYAVSSKVYIYDKQTKKTQTVDMCSETIPNELDIVEFENMDWGERLKKEYITSRFCWVHYSEKLKKYFRVHYQALEKFNSPTEERLAYLMVYDEKNQTTKEYLLPTQFSEIYFIHDDVLYFDFDGTNDDVLGFAKIDLLKL